MSTLSMVLIARDEAHNIDRCLSSFWDHVDQVVLVDTGSRDGTILAARNFAAKRRDSAKLKIGHFEWCDDFAAARNHADTLAASDWVTWCDLDDEIVGAEHLKPMIDQAPADVVAFFALYNYAQDQHGNTLSELWRERLVRNNDTRWQGRLHEHKLLTQGTVVKIDPAQAQWVHRRPHDDDDAQNDRERNLRILQAWEHDQPDDPRVISALGMELMGLERHADAAAAFRRYLALPGEQADRRAQTSRYLAVMLMILDQPSEARDVAFASVRETWGWADTHLSLAESAQTLGQPQEGYMHAQAALQIGAPDTLLIVNPLQYTAHPKAVMAVCAAQTGQLEEALRLADEVLAISPSYGLLTGLTDGWRHRLRTDRTVSTILSITQLLIDHGELLKAGRVLDAVPVFATDDPRIIGAREKVMELTGQRRQLTPPELEPDSAPALFFARHLEASPLEQLDRAGTRPPSTRNASSRPAVCVPVVGEVAA